MNLKFFKNLGALDFQLRKVVKCYFEFAWNFREITTYFINQIGNWLIKKGRGQKSCKAGFVLKKRLKVLKKLKLHIFLLVSWGLLVRIQLYMQSAKPNLKTAIYALQKYKARISRSAFMYYCSLRGLVVHTKPKRKKKLILKLKTLLCC